MIYLDSLIISMRLISLSKSSYWPHWWRKNRIRACMINLTNLCILILLESSIIWFTYICCQFICNSVKIRIWVAQISRRWLISIIVEFWFYGWLDSIYICWAIVLVICRWRLYFNIFLLSLHHHWLPSGYTNWLPSHFSLR